MWQIADQRHHAYVNCGSGGEFVKKKMHFSPTPLFGKLA